MTKRLTALLLLSLVGLTWRPLAAMARLGETEAQAQARYGAPDSNLISPTDEPLLGGAKELAYNHDGWRIRVAYLNGTAARLEYIKLPDAGALKKIGEEEVRAILEAEKGAYIWREERPRLGNSGLNALKTALDGRTWERSDHAMAKLKLDLVLIVEIHDADATAKRLEKSKAAPGAGSILPKF